jgi:hypothetical protein
MNPDETLENDLRRAMLPGRIRESADFTAAIFGQRATLS